jgi:hypothetical protein
MPIADLLLPSISVGQQLLQAGFVLGFLFLFLVLQALHRLGRSQHRPGRRLHRTDSAEFLKLFLFRHDSY